MSSKEKPQLNIVGQYMRKKREEAGLSQRSLGLLFQPPVTTQFISNVERGVTPLPSVHIQNLIQILKIQESELLSEMEREYAAKISSKLGHSPIHHSTPSDQNSPLYVPKEDLHFFEKFISAYKNADPKTKETIRQLIDTALIQKTST